MTKPDSPTNEEQAKWVVQEHSQSVWIREAGEEGEFILFRDLSDGAREFLTGLAADHNDRADFQAKLAASEERADTKEAVATALSIDVGEARTAFKDRDAKLASALSEVAKLRAALAALRNEYIAFPSLVAKIDAALGESSSPQCDCALAVYEDEPLGDGHLFDCPRYRAARPDAAAEEAR